MFKKDIYTQFFNKKCFELMKLLAILLCFRDVCQNKDVLLSNYVEVFYNVLDIRHHISTI